MSGFGYGINLQFTKGQCAALIYAKSLSGSMDAAAEQDAYRFSGAAGDVVLITAASGPGSPTYIISELFNPTGASMKVSAANGTIGPIEFTASGTYTILVRSGNVQVSGFGYGINLQFTKGQCVALISCGQSLSGSIDAAAEQDAYRLGAGMAMWLSSLLPQILAAGRT